MAQDFIEVHLTDGEARLINRRHIMIVVPTPESDTFGSLVYTTDNRAYAVTETYEELINMLL